MCYCNNKRGGILLIFSSKIYKLETGKNISLFSETENNLNAFLFNKSMNLYNISTNNKINCTFLKKFNYHKIIKLNHNHSCICYGNDMTIYKNEDIV